MEKCSFALPNRRFSLSHGEKTKDEIQGKASRIPLQDFVTKSLPKLVCN